MLRKFPDTVFLQQTDANLINRGNLLAEQRTNTLGELGQVTFPACPFAKPAIGPEIQEILDRLHLVFTWTSVLQKRA